MICQNVFLGQQQHLKKIRLIKLLPGSIKWEFDQEIFWFCGAPTMDQDIFFTLQLYYENYVVCYELGSDQAAKSTIAGRILIYVFSCYIPTKTPKKFQQKNLLEHFVSEAGIYITKLKGSVS